jgi:predicted transcriptional regulator
MSTTQGIKLDDETSKRLKALAKQRNRSAHWLMRAAIEIYLEREEHYEREKSEDAARWEQYLLTGRAVAAPEVEAWLTDLAHDKPTKWPN